MCDSCAIRRDTYAVLNLGLCKDLPCLSICSCLVFSTAATGAVDGRALNQELTGFELISQSPDCLMARSALVNSRPNPQRQAESVIHARPEQARAV